MVNGTDGFEALEGSLRAAEGRLGRSIACVVLERAAPGSALIYLSAAAVMFLGPAAALALGADADGSWLPGAPSIWAAAHEGSEARRALGSISGLLTLQALLGAGAALAWLSRPVRELLRPWLAPGLRSRLDAAHWAASLGLQPGALLIHVATAERRIHLATAPGGRGLSQDHMRRAVAAGAACCRREGAEAGIEAVLESLTVSEEADASIEDPRPRPGPFIRI